MRRSTPLLCLSLALACGGTAEGPIEGTRARFDPSALRSGDFFALPFPTDLRRDGVGLLLDGFPNPKASALLDTYLAALHDAVPAFGAASALYVGFSGAIDPASLPAGPAETLAAGSPVQLVDLGDLGRLGGGAPDPAGAGDRVPLLTRWSAEATLFLPARTLALLPVPGWPLRPRHTYALVVRGALRDAAGRPVVADAAMRRALGLWEATPGAQAAIAATAPFVAWARAAGLPLDDVALASVFTVQDSSGPMRAVRAAVHATAAPAAQALRFVRTRSATHVFAGTFDVPAFQRGAPPYLSKGGDFAFSTAGVPAVQRTEQVRFALTVPRGPAPAGGFPLLLYAHGTGGSYLSCSDEGLADLFAASGIATLGMDQVLHGPRNPACDEASPAYGTCVGTAYFNFLNPWAGRDNGRQGGADLFQLARLAHGLAVPAALHPQGLAAALDPSRLVFLGHSQGGLTGAPFAAAEPELKAAILSGTGGVLALTILQRKDPLDFKALAEQLLGISGLEALEPFHPVLALVQTFIEPADPISYARHLQREPLGGGARDLLLFEGLLDPYTPAETSEALGAAALVDLGAPAAHQGAAFLLRGLSVRPLPLAGNVALPGGARTGALLQFPSRGHFAIFEDAAARCRLSGFAASALAGAGRVEACP